MEFTGKKPQADQGPRPGNVYGTHFGITARIRYVILQIRSCGLLGLRRFVETSNSNILFALSSGSATSGPKNRGTTSVRGWTRLFVGLDFIAFETGHFSAHRSEIADLGFNRQVDFCASEKNAVVIFQATALC